MQDRSKLIESELEKSHNTAASNTPLTNKFEYLFEDAKRRNEHLAHAKKLIYDSQCTFKPDIGQTKSHLAKFEDQSFIERMINSKRDAQTTRDNLINNAVVSVDQKTGQPLFKPKVGRAPNKQRNSASLPIGDYLYSQNKVKQYEHDRRVKQSLLNQEISAKQPQAHHTSSRIIIKLKRESYVLLFAQFDADQDGLISSNKINLAGFYFLFLGFMRFF